MSASTRYWHLDALKGAAMLCVLMIHADPLQGSLFHQIVVNRAVPVLLVLFGVSSQLWWSRAPAPFLEAARSFWRSRLVRLMPPVWVAVCLWWLLVPGLGIAPAPGWRWLPAHAVGYVPQLGTGWFITLIVQLVLLFPLLILSLRLLGPVLALGAGLAVTFYTHLHAAQIADWMSALLLHSAGMEEGFFHFYYFWIFAPARCFPLLAGMILAQRGLRVSPALAVACAVLVTAGEYVQRSVLADPLTRIALGAILDVPFTIAALALVRLALSERSASPLIWLGRSSWGIYLGQMLVHCMLYEAWLRTFGDSTVLRWLYFACLLLGALVWVEAERLVRRAARRAALVAEPSTVPE